MGDVQTDAGNHAQSADDSLTDPAASEPNSLTSHLFGRPAFELLTGAWKRLNPIGRLVFAFAFCSYVVGAFLLVAVLAGITDRWIPASWAWPIGMISVLGLFLSASMASEARRVEGVKRYEAAETRARDNPEKPRYAWDLARIKLESYLDRNLRQVSSIFYLTSAVMACGMGLIGFGVWRSFAETSALAPAALAAASGIVVQVIGGTFLIVYKATMEQARNYVVVLERINAVGMSINILETIDDVSAGARDNARAELARDLLKMYSPSSKQDPTP